MAASLREIITTDGDEAVAARLGFSAVYMRHIRRGVRAPSANVLRRAKEAYGRRLDLAASLAHVASAEATSNAGGLTGEAA